ncbi:YdcH family protein [Shewanella maritima]|uniref:YdcH family protein n=1 Tax=Shewanella maritima TaxID=2520507 RepID=UPI00373656D0
MLGENHSLTHEFPEHENKILLLCKQDPSFAQETNKYNALDKEIRELELNSAPISDEDMHQLKHDRAELKDMLFQRLQSEA